MMLVGHQDHVTMVGYFHWGHVNSQVYKNRLKLKADIIPVIDEVEPQLGQNIIEIFNKSEHT